MDGLGCSGESSTWDERKMPQFKRLSNWTWLQHDVGEEGYELKTLLICFDKGSYLASKNTQYLL